EIPVYFFLRQYWEDKRLAGKLNRSITIAGGVIGKFWKPDIYCYNARQSNLMVEDKDVNSRLTINTSGAIHYSRGSTVVASCDMNLRNFPMDTQHCRLMFISADPQLLHHSQSDSDIIFSWKTKTITVDQKEMSQFNLDGIELGRRAKIYYGVNYTQIFFTISLTRRSGYYIIQVYCPDILIVALSWIVLWMDADAIGDRLSLGITTILTVMFLLGSTNSSMPKVSYAKALDWYLLVSFAFVFMTLFESMLVFMMIARDDGSKKNTEKASEIRRS
ncbi:hypothetical protein QZH41_009701, partial [Actinostola sp. cb2023]